MKLNLEYTTYTNVAIEKMFSEMERMGQMRDLKISLITFKEKEFHVILVKLIVSYKMSTSEL